MDQLAERSKAHAAISAATKASPRLAEGARIYDLFPPLIGPVERWFGHLPRIARMGLNWVLVSDPRQPSLSDDEAGLQAFIEGRRGARTSRS